MCSAPWLAGPRVRRQSRQFVEMLLGGEARLVGMDSDGREDPIAARGHVQAGPQVIRPRTAADRHEVANPARPGSLENLFPVLVELGKFEVGVRIGEGNQIGSLGWLGSFG